MMWLYALGLMMLAGHIRAQCAYTYTVQPGDTLNGIAQHCGADYQTIASMSGITNANLIYPGQVICLPFACANYAAGSQCAYSYYVAPGDTLSGIASRCNMNLATLEAMNTQLTNYNLIYPCQRICLPSSCYLGAGYTGCSSYAYASSTGCAYSYTVGAGESLNSIANTCGISSYQNIASLNNIAYPYTIYPCQTLCLPSACTNYNVGYSNCATGVSFFSSSCSNTYYVAPGQTLNWIASQCGTTASEIASLSGIVNPNLIYPCEKLCLPSTCNIGHGYTGYCGTLNNCAYPYVVRPGDTLGNIAAACGTTYQTIQQLSNIANPNVINVCQVVCLPYPCSIGYGYTTC